MHKNIKLLLVVFVLAFGFGIWNITSGDDTTDTTSIVTVEGLQFSAEGETVNYAGVAGETALQTLQNLTDVRTQSSDFGEFVTGIGNVNADSSANFWGFYVNGEMAEVGAGSYVAEEGDQIEWRLEEIVF